MENLTSLFKLAELTRSQPQYGYALAGIKKGDLSDLAQHHFLVTFIAWQLARNVIRNGGNVSVEKVLEFALIHDMGELFGGDIAMPYAKANPRARKLAKAFEAENQKYLGRFFGSDKKHFRKLCAEIMDASCDEAIVAKLADYIEVTLYKEYCGKLTAGDIAMAERAMEKKISRMHDAVSKEFLGRWIKMWKEQMKKSYNAEFFETSKSK